MYQYHFTVSLSPSLSVSYNVLNLMTSVMYRGTRIWANAQPDGRPAEHRWRPLFNAAKFG